jgi:hypothetical protein
VHNQYDFVIKIFLCIQNFVILLDSCDNFVRAQHFYVSIDVYANLLTWNIISCICYNIAVLLFIHHVLS